MTDLSNLRREYRLESLDESEILGDPIEMFRRWFEQAVRSGVVEPNAMSLATASPQGVPSSRIVLLKQILDSGFVYFTNYDSRKGQQLAANAHCALNFNWLELERQVRVEGKAYKLTAAESDSYFEMRPLGSKLGAWTSPQSQKIPNREFLDTMMKKMETEWANKPIERPENWGGYIVKPTLIEFWQGQPSRLHDRIQYTLEGAKWEISRLAP